MILGLVILMKSHITISNILLLDGVTTTHSVVLDNRMLSGQAQTNCRSRGLINKDFLASIYAYPRSKLRLTSRGSSVDLPASRHCFAYCDFNAAPASRFLLPF